MGVNQSTDTTSTNGSVSQPSPLEQRLQQQFNNKGQTPTSVEEVIQMMKGDPAEARERVTRLLGLTDEDELKVVGEQFGLQSNSFRLRGPRWGENGAFIKVLPNWTVRELVDIQRESAREDAERRARELGMDNEEEIKKIGQEAYDQLEITAPAEPSSQMKRERFVLRQIWDALDSGELKLPEDTLLTFPRLFDNDIIVDEEERLKEEERPSMLVFEDLGGRGFRSQSYKDAIDDDACMAVVKALADFHGALWTIRERLGFGCEGTRGKGVSDTSSAKMAMREFYEQSFRECIEKMKEWSNYRKLTDMLDESFCTMVEVFGNTTDEIPRMVVHGDPWGQNIMLCHGDTEKVCGVAFVDLGSVQEGNPLADMYTFLQTAGDAKCVNRRKKSQEPPDAVIVFQDRLIQSWGIADTRILQSLAIAHGAVSALIYFFDTERWNVYDMKGTTSPTVRHVQAFARAHFAIEVLQQDEKRVDGDVSTEDSLRYRRN